jgi:16S rRNA (guanine1207-N2)-methyltransferase
MSHYFSKSQASLKSKPQELTYTIKGHTFTFLSDYGVFAKDKVDYATDLLLNHISIDDYDTVLDLGCGYGVIGIVLKRMIHAHVTMSDVNPRALDLAKKNAELNKTDIDIINSDGFKAIDQTFDHIISNPPIRIGKKPLYLLFRVAKSHLKIGGSLWLVINKKHGAKSAITYLKTLYHVEVIAKQKGFHVIRCLNTLTN